MKSPIQVSPYLFNHIIIKFQDILDPTTDVWLGHHTTPWFVIAQQRVLHGMFQHIWPCPYRFDPVFINLKAKPEWYNNIVPLGKVPALLVDHNIVYESLIIADFLDEKFSQRPLHSKDPLRKAKDRILIDGFGKVRYLRLTESHLHILYEMEGD